MEIKMGEIKTVVGSIIIGLGTIVGLSYLASSYQNVVHKRIAEATLKNSKVSSCDFNSDGLVDITIEQNSGNKIIYYNTGNEYLTAEQIKEREIQKIEQSYQEQLRLTNEFYKKAYSDMNNLGGSK